MALLTALIVTTLYAPIALTIFFSSFWNVLFIKKNIKAAIKIKIKIWIIVLTFIYIILASFIKFKNLTKKKYSKKTTKIHIYFI